MLQCCLNGARPTEGGSVVPAGPTELARDARAVADLGVTSLHVHPRGTGEHEDLTAETVGPVVAAIRHAAPDSEIVVPMARWVEPDPLVRTELVARWADLPAEQRPDAVAVNVHDTGWQHICAALDANGLGIELGVWTPGDAVRLTQADLPRGTTRVVAEVTVTDPCSAVLEAARLLRALGPVAAPILLHGEDDGAWPVLDYAVRTRLDTRIGVEDTLTGPGAGTTTMGNADLVRAALAAQAAAPAPTTGQPAPTSATRPSGARRPPLAPHTTDRSLPRRRPRHRR